MDLGEGDLRGKLSYWRLEISIKGEEVRTIPEEGKFWEFWKYCTYKFKISDNL